MEKKTPSSSPSSTPRSASTSSSSSSFSFFLKRLNKLRSGGGGIRRWKLKNSAGMRWKRRFNLHLWFIDDFLFKIVSVFEGIVLVSTVCIFFVCCGCHF